MLSNFRVLSALCSLGALFIIAGFFLTSLPIFIQIIFLLIGLIICIITLVSLIKLFILQSKNKDAKQ